MRGGASRIGVVSLLLLVLLLPSAEAQSRDKMCRYEGPAGTFEYPCGSGEAAPASEPAEDPWWATATAQATLGIVGLVASGSAGAYTVYRVRTKRRRLSETLAAIERAYVAAKSRPENGIAELAGIRAQLRADHGRGRVDDAQFLELDKRATEYLVKLRTLEIDRRFALLPPLLLNEVRRLLSDGVLTHTEADLIEVRAAAYRVSEPARVELATLARRWADEDAPRDAVAPAPPA